MYDKVLLRGTVLLIRAPFVFAGNLSAKCDGCAFYI